jgi:hypothetical protein
VVRREQERSGRTISATALPERSANAEGWPKPKTEEAVEKRRNPSGRLEKRLPLHAKGPKPPNENKMSCGERRRAWLRVKRF